MLYHLNLFRLDLRSFCVLSDEKQARLNILLLAILQNMHISECVFLSWPSVNANN